MPKNLKLIQSWAFKGYPNYIWNYAFVNYIINISSSTNDFRRDLISGFPALAPLSDGGRAFTVIFSIFGIPLFLVAAIGMGEVLNLLAETLRVCLLSKSRKECSPTCGAKTFRTTLISILGIFFFLIIPSIIFKHIEPWTYAEAFYFSFITLATIGFGDLVPTYNGRLSNYLLLFYIN